MEQTTQKQTVSLTPRQWAAVIRGRYRDNSDGHTLTYTHGAPMISQ